MHKGQFMLLSSIVTVLLLLSASAIITDFETRTYDQNQRDYQSIYIQDEIEKIDNQELGNDVNRQNFELLLEFSDYQYEEGFTFSSSCVNIRIESYSEDVDFECN